MPTDHQPAPPATAASGADGSGSLMTGGLVMLVLALLLSWLPLLGPAIAGFLGGRVVGEPRRALGIALLPAVLLALVVGLVLAAFDLPVIGAVAGAGVIIAIVVQELPLLAGAWMGGASASRATGSAAP